jgi:hypothetical protein|eukprot:COSAG01_NODE_5813_length_4018_cov_3.527686_6_plen_87_part_00
MCGRVADGGGVGWKKRWALICRGRLLWYEEPLRKKGLMGHIELSAVRAVRVVSETAFELEMADDREQVGEDAGYTLRAIDVYTRCR